MISDVLFEALEEIERYQREIPGAYGDAEMTRKIEAVKVAMRELQDELDTPPTPEQVESARVRRGVV